MYDIIISGDVVHDNRISIPTKYFYGIVRGLCGRNGVCYATNAYFKRAYVDYVGEDISDKQIQRYIRTLIDCDKIVVSFVDNKKRKIELSTTTTTKMSKHHDKNVEYNICKNNNDCSYYNNTTHAHACEADEFTPLRTWYSCIFPSRSALIEALSGILDLDTINVVFDALCDVSVYAYCYAAYFDSKKLMRIARYIAAKPDIDVCKYVKKSYAVPDAWADYAHVQALNEIYKARAF